MFIVILVTMLISKSISEPIRKLHEGTEIVISGNLSHKIKVYANDEIGQLSTSFNKMTMDLHGTYNQLVHAEKLGAIGKLSASIAHEFNNPICGIRNVLESLDNKRANDLLNNDDRKFVSLAIKDCDRMADLIRKLRDFYRPSSGRVLTLDIHEAIDEILFMIKKQLKQRNIEVEKHYELKTPNIEVIPDQIKQVLLNLMQNAEDAILESGGRITISTKSLDNYVVIQISDTGGGITDEDIKSIFEPFFTTKSAVKGTGLGLSICYGIIKSHKGDINVESKVDKGTTFTITLPVAVTGSK